MADKRVFIVKTDNPRRDGVVQGAIAEITQRAQMGADFEIEIRDPKRTLDANACMWATLGDIADQVPWPHTKRGLWIVDRMGTTNWKHVLTAAFEEFTEMAQGIEGGAVMMGAKTSEYSRRKMGDFIESVHAFGADRGVRWSVRAQDELATFGRR